VFRYKQRTMSSLPEQPMSNDHDMPTGGSHSDHQDKPRPDNPSSKKTSIPSEQKKWVTVMNTLNGDGVYAMNTDTGVLVESLVGTQTSLVFISGEKVDKNGVFHKR